MLFVLHLVVRTGDRETRVLPMPFLPAYPHELHVRACADSTTVVDGREKSWGVRERVQLRVEFY